MAIFYFSPECNIKLLISKEGKCLIPKIIQCSTYLVHLTWMICEMRGKGLHNCCFVGMLLPGFVKKIKRMQHCCVVTKLLLQAFR